MIWILMKLKIEVKSWNNYPPPPHTHTHTPREGGGLLGLPCIQRQLLMDAKLFSGNTKCQKDSFSENKPVWIA